MAFDKRKSLQNALAYTQQGKWDRAIVEYQAILRADPRDVTVCNNLGDLYARAGKTADAIDQYLKLGELYRADGLSVKAIAVYKKIAKLDPARTEAYLACADLYWEQGLVGEAKIQMATVVEHYSKAGDAPKLLDAYKRLSQFDPTNAALITRLADLMLRDGKREAAAVEYERAAQAAQAVGQAAEAKRLLQKARELSPGTPEASVPLAQRLIGEGRVSEGIDVLRAVTRSEPKDAKAWCLLGEVQAAQRQAGEAIEALQRAVALGIAEGEVARPLGLALLEANRADDTVALCQRVTETSIVKGEPDTALACCREILAAAPQLTALHTHFAATLQALGRTEECRAALRVLATTQEGMGETEAAVATYRRLLDSDPADAQARARLDILAPPPPPAPEPQEQLPTVEDQIPQPAVEAPALSVSSLEDLGLSLGTEDARILLEEPDSALPDGVPNLPPSTLEAHSTEAAGDESSQGADWLTQELQSIDLDRVASDALAQRPTTLEPLTEGRSLEVDDIVSHLSEPGVSGLAHDPELDLGSTGLLDQESPIEVPVVEVPDVAAEVEASLIDLPTREPEMGALDRPEDDADGSVAEQLAEADVYQKYGLEEKARERLLEVVRLAPENLTARRRLKAIYADRRQNEEVCAEILAIARILRARGQEAAAAAEVREGLLLLPDQPDLQQFLSGVARPDESPSGARAEAGIASDLLGQRTTRVAVPVAPTPGLADSAQAAGAAVDEAPPPDVPLLLELNEAALSAEETHEVVLGEGSPDAEGLPTELQALLDDSQAEPVVVIDEKDTGQDQAMMDDVAEAEFYLSQGMTDEARVVHRRMESRDPRHPAVAALADQISVASAAPTRDEPRPVVPQEVPPPEAEIASPMAEPSPMADVGGQEIAAQFTVMDRAPEDAQVGFVDLGAELDQELDAGEATSFADTGGPLVDGLLKELQKGVREQLDEKDYETHYNLGIAYKEMELYDEAIQEFRLTAREPKRALECADLVGLCYLAKGQPEQAIQDLQAGLAVAGHAPEAYHNLRYDLATAFEAIGDLARALEQFEILQAEGARFLDVQTRLHNLQAQLARAPGPTAKDQPPRRKKKISFI